MALALKWVLCLFFISCITNVTKAQPKRSPSATQIEDPNKQIAHILFEQNEFAKANILLEDIVNADPSDELSYNRYMICLRLALQELSQHGQHSCWISILPMN